MTLKAEPSVPSNYERDPTWYRQHGTEGKHQGEKGRGDGKVFCEECFWPNTYQMQSFLQGLMFRMLFPSCVRQASWFGRGNAQKKPLNGVRVYYLEDQQSCSEWNPIELRVDRGKEV